MTATTANHPKNVQERARLPYAPAVWDTPLEIQLQTEGAHNDGESFRNALRGCFLGFVDIMKQLQMKELSWKGKRVDPETIFNLNPTEVGAVVEGPLQNPQDNENNPNHPHNTKNNNLMTVEELKGRRALVVRAIEQNMKDSPKTNPVLVDCKVCSRFIERKKK